MANTLTQVDSNPKLQNSPILEKVGYQPIFSNWYTAKPYGFRFTPKDGKNAKIMFLPINPSNLTITTHFATNIVPTIYGTVEEHSPVRYFDISIEGTTGMTPKFIEPVDAKAYATPESGRTSFSVQQFLPTNGFFSKTLGTANKIIQEVSNAVSGGAKTGVQLDQTGYIAFHNLYRFLLKYKQDASGEVSKAHRTSTVAPLVFFNYKDNNEYNVVVRSFTLRRDKENPMLYYYNISMRGYGLTNLSKDAAQDTKNNNDIASELGLDGVKGSSFLTTAKVISTETKSVLGAAANGINLFGR